MKIMLLAEDFPQVATRATKPSESLHRWSGPEKEKQSGQKRKRVVSALVGPKKNCQKVRGATVSGSWQSNLKKPKVEVNPFVLLQAPNQVVKRSEMMTWEPVQS